MLAMLYAYFFSCSLSSKSPGGESNPLAGASPVLGSSPVPSRTTLATFFCSARCDSIHFGCNLKTLQGSLVWHSSLLHPLGIWDTVICCSSVVWWRMSCQELDPKQAVGSWTELNWECPTKPLLPPLTSLEMSFYLDCKLNYRCWCGFKEAARMSWWELLREVFHESLLLVNVLASFFLSSLTFSKLEWK